MFIAGVTFPAYFYHIILVVHLMLFIQPTLIHAIRADMKNNCTWRCPISEPHVNRVDRGCHTVDRGQTPCRRYHPGGRASSRGHRPRPSHVGPTARRPGVLAEPGLAGGGGGEEGGRRPATQVKSNKRSTVAADKLKRLWLSMLYHCIYIYICCQ